jgi:uncharacterized iron-regulated membrane protein
LKIFFRRIHLYLAFVAGLVIMITCFTGAVLVFEEELQHAFHKERFFVTPGKDAKPLETLIVSIQQQIPGSIVNGVKVFTDPTRSMEISISSGKESGKPTLKKKGAEKKEANRGGRIIAFVNPYSGEIIEQYDHRKSFFFTMMSLHRWLLGGDTGKLIVGVCTLLFLIILITGIILWWPKTSNILKQRLKVKWQGGWKRLNHDVHVVLGFYASIFLFIFAFTGLAWSFSWFNKAIYTITNSSMEQSKPPVISYQSDTKTLSYDQVLQCIKNNNSRVYFYNINAPKDSVSPYSVTVLPFSAAHESANDLYLVDRYEQRIIYSQKYSERNTGQKVRSTFKPVHIASIWGLPSKIIGFLVCILGVIFPATGYIMWWLRTRRK